MENLQFQCRTGHREKNKRKDGPFGVSGNKCEEYNLVVELVTKISCFEFGGHVINTLFRTRQI